MRYRRFWTARRRGWVVVPRADRWHQKPTAVYGGVGIFIAFAAAFLLLGPGGPLYWTLLACAAAMFLLGLVDDARAPLLEHRDEHPLHQQPHAGREYGELQDFRDEDDGPGLRRYLMEHFRKKLVHGFHCPSPPTPRVLLS